jgi:uncharacterized Ntn-hydrolase superfamily protein
MTAIVARDPDTGDLGVAVESKYLAVGAVVPFARANVGAIACAGIPNAEYGARGLELLASGSSPDEVLGLLTSGDADAARRQVAIVDARGRTATFTGDVLKKISEGWSDGIEGRQAALIGTSLIGEATLTLMRDTFVRTPGPLWHRLVEALEVGQHMGGDVRPLQQHSAALLVARAQGGYGGYDDRIVDVRVDDHRHPVEELSRILEIYLEHFHATNPAELVPLDSELIKDIQTRLVQTRDYHGWVTGNYDAATHEALERYAGRHNLEERMQTGESIDPKLLEDLEVPEMWRLRLARSRDRARKP